MNDKLFYGTRGPREASIMIVGESWGNTEEREQLPFVGSSGKLLEQLLAQVGLDIDDCFITNLIPKRPPANKMEYFLVPTDKEKTATQLWGLYPTYELAVGIDNLYKQIEAVKPRAIIAFGNFALWALSQGTFCGFSRSTVQLFGKPPHRCRVPTGVATRRGSQLYIPGTDQYYVPKIHPAAAMRDWPSTFLIKHDNKNRILQRQEEPQREFITAPTFVQAMAALFTLRTMLANAPTQIAVDIENVGDFITCIGLARSKTRAICIPFKTNSGPYWPEDQEIQIISTLRAILTHPNARLIGQNFIYDAQFLISNLFAKPRIAFDTMMMHSVAYPGTPRGLHYLASLYAEHYVYWKEDNGSKAPTEEADSENWRYNCLDCVYTYEAAERIREELYFAGLEDKIEECNELWEATLEMMLPGVRYDKEKASAFGLQLMEARAEREEFLSQAIDDSIYPRGKKKTAWYDSSHQQKEIFYDILGLKPILHKDTKRPTVNDDAIQRLAKQAPLLAPIIQRLQELRSIGTFYSSFIQKATDLDGRMRCTFDPAGTETFRYRSYETPRGTGGNLQNIPKGNEIEE